MTRSILILFIITMLAASVRAQSASELDLLDFEDLLNVDVITVSSRKPLTKKQVPGNVTVFNESEIANSGARNLIDLLRLVPGLSFGYNDQNGVGLGVRGNWAHEGKALLVIDGMPMNETLYGSMGQMFDFPISQIKQIEVIRGPGASFYGGFAELAVISIKTKATEGYRGAEISATGGLVSSGAGTMNASAMAGWANNGAFATLSVFGGSYIRGEGNYRDINVTPVDIYEGNVNRPLMINSQFGYKNLKAQIFFRQDQGTYQDAYDALPEPLDITHRRIIGQLSYDWELNQDWIITPKVSVAYHQPWQTESELANSTEDTDYTTEASRILGSVMVSGEFSKNWNTLNGVEVFVDRGFNAAPGTRFGDNADQTSITYTNFAAFTQQNLITDAALFNAGLRFDYNDSFGSALMPWLGANKEFGKFNAKVLYGYTFRAPTIENVRLISNREPKPERTRLWEVELGYQVSPKVFASFTFFDQKINSPIIYSIGQNNAETYRQFGNSGSRGFETELRYSSPRIGYVNLSYSFYAAAHSQVPDFRVPGENASYTGLAPHKVALAGSFNVADELTINPTLTFLSERNGWTGLGVISDPMATPPALIPNSFDPVFLVNVNIRKQNLIKNVDVMLSVMDLFDQQFVFVQPFNSLASPLPALGREVLLTASIKF